MYLKRIEIAGFKSFADRTVIEFNQGLTAVVGPNGSGKSNIIEAIRWVLGEQSAKNLRGGKMPDVIFAGSSSRSPLNIAEVTMVLDNEDQFLPIDFNEVSIKRRLSRSGDSDFFINQSACRLKDIIQLFMDSGLGKESFSIISQGKVESIFNSKPEERRGIFEEAAGVLKYKTKKKEAERRLFETEDNLNRLQDIILELEGQLTPLKAQSDVAQKYLNLKEQLTTVDVGVTVEEIKRFKSVWEEQNTSLFKVNQEITKLQNEAECLELEAKQLKEKREQLNEQVDEEQTRLLALTTDYEQLEGQKKVYDERQKHSSATKEQHEETLFRLEETIAQLTGEIKESRHEQHEKLTMIKALEKRLAQLEFELSKVSRSVKEQMDDLRSDYVEVMQQQSNINNDLRYLNRQYEQELARNQKDVQQLDAIVSLEETSAKEQTKLVKEQEQLSLELEELLVVYQKNQHLMQEVEQQAQITERQMYEALKILQQAQAREKSLKEVQENYAHFYQGVRAILKAREQFEGIVGAVAEVIAVPKDLSTAIEIALGGAAQSIIVENETTARSAITYLTQKRAGRATFLPLTVIKGRKVAATTLAKVENEEGFLGVASDLITYDTRYSQVVTNLLGLTLLAKDLKTANQLAKQINYQYRVVSLQGDIMNPGGSMTGGANKRGTGSNLFSQASELKELVQQIAQMQRLYQTKEQAVAKLKAESMQLKEKLETDRSHGEQLRLQLQTVSNRLEQLTVILNQQLKERQAFEYEKKELQRFLENYTEEKEQLEEALSELTKRRVDLDELMSQTGNLEETNQKRKELLQVEKSEKQAQLAVVNEQQQHLQGRISETEIRLKDAQAQYERLTEQVTSVNNQQSMTHTYAKEIIDKMMTERNELARIKEKLLVLKENREERYAQVKQCDQQLLEKNRELQFLIDNKTSMEVMKNRASVSLDHSLDYLKTEYQLTYEAAAVTYSLDASFDESKQKIQALKDEISQLGAVNTQAIAQYSEVAERYDFLKAQRDDLLTAKEELFTTMDEMDALVIEKFHDVFCDIREEFRHVFPDMFGGGYADLELTDPSDLLNTGIEIIAQPPGKKLQQLSLLSGGERALTAIALLFAIIQARPVPFCILDEVEAALDDANVTRFGAYLKNFGEERQFIVITHRKGTMEAADRLYGVTMQESGVSKMVSVRLDDFVEKTN